MTTNRAGLTRRRIQAAAIALFEEQGFAATTVDQIAKAAEVSHVTVFRHFGSKEAIAVDAPFDPIIAQRVKAQPRSLTPLVRVCRGYREALAGTLPADDLIRRRITLTATVPALEVAAWANTVGAQRAIVEALPDVARARASAAAGAVLGATTAAMLEWGRAKPLYPLTEALVRAIDVIDPEAVSPRL